MNLFPMNSSVKVWLATGHTDMRCGFPTLALRVQEILKHILWRAIYFAFGDAKVT